MGLMYKIIELDREKRGKTNDEHSFSAYAGFRF